MGAEKGPHASPETRQFNHWSERIMPGTTNHLVEAARKLSLPAAVAAAFGLGAAIFAGHGGVRAATNTPPLDDNSIAALTSIDHAMEAVAAKVTPAVVNVS